MKPQLFPFRHRRVVLAVSVILLGHGGALAQYAGAIPSLSALQEKVRREPGNQDALYELGRRYLDLSQQLLERAHSIDPDSAVSHLMEGEIAEGTGNMKLAQTEYETAVSRAANRADVHEHLGSVLWLQGLWAAALPELQQASRLDPGNCRVEWKEADVLLNQQEPGKALPLLQAATQSCPQLDQARVDRAKALILLNRAPEALTDLLLAEKHTPEEPGIHFLLAKVYRAQGHAEDASRELAEFQRLSSGNGTKTP